MATEGGEVYLDHLIPRESLRYRRSTLNIIPSDSDRTSLRISDLVGNHMSSRQKILRKPDFQRATWAWTPKDCVLLLDSLVKGQVIPSIIMWSNPDSGLDFVLDGAHRISVVIAWMTDDWGDKLPKELYGEPQREKEIKTAAQEVRTLVKTQIGSFEDFEQAHEEQDRIVNEGLGIPKEIMGDAAFSRARFYQKLVKGAHFHILWVTGDYENAEQSFLRINKSGRYLDEWETKLIENRNSSFARTIMSVANVYCVEHYWPSQVSDLTESGDQSKVDKVVGGIQQIANLLFEPARQPVFTHLVQPLIDIPERYKRPYWLGELFTVLEGHRGQENETQKFLESGKHDNEVQIIESGISLVSHALSRLERLRGYNQRSLSIPALLYFYTSSGRYVRSLLYGFAYWMFRGSEDEVQTRLRVFSAYRGSFEAVLIERKEDVVTGITRKTTSGPGVTVPTASYFQSVLSLLIETKGNPYTDEFREGYAETVRKLTSRKPHVDKLFVAQSRVFTSRQKSITVVDTLIKRAPRCGICDGILDLNLYYEHDHVLEHSKGGETSTANQRLVHPFCNNDANRREIEAIRSGRKSSELPFFDLDPTQPYGQLSFFDIIQYD